MSAPTYKTVHLDCLNDKFEIVPEKLDTELNRYAGEGWLLHSLVPDTGATFGARFITVLVKK